MDSETKTDRWTTKRRLVETRILQTKPAIEDQNSLIPFCYFYRNPFIANENRLTHFSVAPNRTLWNIQFIIKLFT